MQGGSRFMQLMRGGYGHAVVLAFFAGVVFALVYRPPCRQQRSSGLVGAMKRAADNADETMIQRKEARAVSRLNQKVE